MNWKYFGVQAVYAALIIRGGVWCIVVNLTRYCYGVRLTKICIRNERRFRWRNNIISWFIIIHISFNIKSFYKSLPIKRIFTLKNVPKNDIIFQIIWRMTLSLSNTCFQLNFNIFYQSEHWLQTCNLSSQIMSSRRTQIFIYSWPLR